MTQQPDSLTWKERYAYWLFWSWNLIFLAFMVFGFAPRLLPELLREVRNQIIPVNYLIYGVVLSVIPLIAVIIGLTFMRGAPRKLFALGYVVEGPLMLILVVRFFIIHQATPAMIFLLSVACVGMAAFLWHLFDTQIERRGRWVGYLRLFGLTLMLLTSLYAAVWIAFYALPLAGIFLNWLGEIFSNLLDFFRNFWRGFRDLFNEGLAWIPVYLLGTILVFYTLSLFAIAPIVIPLLTARAWARVWRSLTARSGKLVPLALVAMTVLVTSALFVVTNRQPQKRAFAMLSKPPVSQEEAQALIKKQTSIRSGLLNAYLAPFRYFSAMGEVRHVRDLFEFSFNMPQETAVNFQLAYESVARPLLYDPVHPQDPQNLRDNLAFQREPQEAAELYQRFFDTPIVEGERDTIVEAVRSTWSANEAEAAWQAVDDREVYLLQQEVNVQEHGDWADVQIMEIYDNKTNEQQEVIYYFNLPESAALTGLWLGDTPNREEAFEFQIAPRGAAQAVYRNEVRRNVDPALLEQIGPRQYRLRAYPVLPPRIEWNADRTQRIDTQPQLLYLWLTYRTMADVDEWPLPQLAYKRNVYWDANTLRTINGARASANADAWVGDSVPSSAPIVAGAHRVDFPGGQSVLAIPDEQANVPGLPEGVRLAVVLDRSYSMSAYAGQVGEALAQLSAQVGAGGVDVYMSASPYRGEAPSVVPLQTLNPDEIVYFGGQNAGELLVQYDELRAGRPYDAVLVLTDGSGYELGVSELDVPLIDAPVWMVHLGGEIPLGYDDATADAIQATGGGVTGDLGAALRRLSLGLSQTGALESGIATRSDSLDGYLWSVMPSAQAQDFAGATLHSLDDGFAALAARQVILAESRLAAGRVDDLDRLDHLHALAQTYGIVTPYSSMIVLVNLRQEFLLDRLSNNEDRFQREQEDLTDTTATTPAPLTGVPEPEEWLLIGLALALLVGYAYRQRFALQRS